jgi:hypothetical protein
MTMQINKYKLGEGVQGLNLKSLSKDPLYF